MAISQAKKTQQARWRNENRTFLRQINRKRRLAIKGEALDHYGWECAECGFDNPMALVIDHVDDNGADERRDLGGRHYAGWNFYSYLKRLGWPEGYQTLCANCNMIKQQLRLQGTCGLAV